ncbi:medium-chain acyl-CoA synthetase [Desulfatibacillum alkenivorans DSM 16219]|jgi:medium-chain acyl-CoA synthetase|uniref:Medium-chain acyl-CoA synthetase n=1 Tax=Desulfatibacillum alkenivorans DSM 16219 TaxID=1121393 RepID=A0A1M6CDB9_9BACT|nr:AMP-binding protein [Desulfatibacillum alkenivorans]SHI58883.1 medium-chain acyl-CoA synthetase [Desulfatibacillum alkenivorans DSM 16219]
MMGATPNMTDYQKEYDEFTWEVPEYFNFAGDVIDKWAQDPDKLAMLWVDDDGNEVRKTFAQLSAASKKLANLLSSLGVGQGDVVMVVLPRNIEWWEVFTACIRMGALLAPGTTQLTSKDLQFRANKAEASCIITNPELAEKFDKVAGECPTVTSKIIITEPREDWTFYTEAVEAASDRFETAKTKSSDNCLVYFTSGTVGFPKMALHTHASYPIGHQVTGKYWLDLKPEDMHWNVSDTGWAKAAWSSYFGPWNMGAAQFIHHTDRFDPIKTLELLAQYPITTMCGAPTIYRMLVLQDLSQFKFPTLRHCVGAGEPLNPEIIEVWKKATGCVIRDGYGQTETVLLAGSFPCIEPRFGSMGKPTPGIELKVIDEDCNELPPNTEGDIAIKVKPNRPVGLFKEYWKEPDRTASVYRGDYYLTGDRAYVDEDGYFWFVGRADDVILTSGYRIGPFEVESALIEHPAVAESAVVSSPDETRGEVVKAFVILANGFTASDELAKELQKHVKNVTAPYKYPRKIEFVDVLPKTVSGKIRRVQLRNQEWGKE